MSFNVRFWSFNKKTNSTKRPVNSDATVYSCVVKNGTRINRPVIELNLGLTVDPSQYNYAQIPNFDRYYYIDEWTFDNGLWIASMHTDALATFKTQIGNASLYVLRASAEKDGRVIDNMYPCKVNCDYDSTILTYPYTSGCYVIGCVSEYGGFGSITYYVLDQTNLTKLVKALIEDVVDTSNGFSLSDASFALQQSIVDPIQYIKSCVWLPFDAGDVTTLPLSLPFEVYGWTFPGVSGSLAVGTRIQKTFTFATKKHPDTNARGNYVNTAPYTHATLNFPPFGSIELDTTVICDVSNITATLDLDVISGRGILRVFANNILLNELKTQMGTPIQLSQITRDYLGAVSNIANAIPSVVGGALTGGPMGIAGAIAGGVGAIGNAVSALAPRSQTIGGSGCFSEIMYQPRLDFQFFRPVEDDNTEHGRPLCKVRQLSTLGGYMLIQDGDIGTVGFKEENDEIRTTLESGFYYE